MFRGGLSTLHSLEAPYGQSHSHRHDPHERRPRRRDHPLDRPHAGRPQRRRPAREPRPRRPVPRHDPVGRGARDQNGGRGLGPQQVHLDRRGLRLHCRDPVQRRRDRHPGPPRHGPAGVRHGPRAAEHGRARLAPVRQRSDDRLAAERRLADRLALPVVLRVRRRVRRRGDLGLDCGGLPDPRHRQVGGSVRARDPAERLGQRRLRRLRPRRPRADAGRNRQLHETR